MYKGINTAPRHRTTALFNHLSAVLHLVLSLKSLLCRRSYLLKVVRDSRWKSLSLKVSWTIITILVNRNIIENRMNGEKIKETVRGRLKEGKKNRQTESCLNRKHLHLWHKASAVRCKSFQILLLCCFCFAFVNLWRTEYMMCCKQIISRTLTGKHAFHNRESLQASS